jgi:S1-C subfamily serine protease
MKLFQHSPLSHIGLQSAAVYAGAFAIGAATVAGFIKLFAMMSGSSLGVSFITFYLGIPLCAVILTGLVSGTIALVRHLHAKPGGTGLQVLDHGTKLVVTAVAEHSPAQKSGIKVGDEIWDINERSVSSFSAEAVSRLLGDKDYSAGSVVSFNIHQKM